METIESESHCNVLGKDNMSELITSQMPFFFLLNGALARAFATKATKKYPRGHKTKKTKKKITKKYPQDKENKEKSTNKYPQRQQRKGHQ